MKFQFTLITLFCVLTSTINAQEFTDEIQNYRIIKYSPISLANIHFPAIQFAFEHNIGESRAMQYEIGGIYLPDFFLFDNDGLFTHRALVEHRWYQVPMQYGNNLYYGFGVRFQKQYQHDVEFAIDNALLALTKSNTAAGIYLTTGNQRQFKNMTFEFGGSLGVQYYNISIYNIPDGIEENDLLTDFDLFSLTKGNYLTPMAFFVCKIGFGWKS